MQGRQIEYKSKRGRRYNDEVEFFDFKEWLNELNKYIDKHIPDRSVREIAAATDLSWSAVKSTLDGYTAGFRSVCRLSSWADISIDKYVGPL